MKEVKEEVFVDMVEVNKITDILCAVYGEENREYIKEVLFLGIDAMLKKMEQK